MSFRLSYRKRILLYFSVIIAVFTAGLFYLNKSKSGTNTKSLENMLDGNANFIHRYIKGRHIVFPDSTQRMDELTAYLSDNLRLTIIDKTGRVMYDNLLDEKTMTNHTDRPEIQKAMVSGSGSNIRMSDSNHIRYLYYARNYDGAYFIRVALPYEVEVRPFLNSKTVSCISSSYFFIVCALMMFYYLPISFPNRLKS